jgi:drug/metabolite transporter (DMT)-like permease
MSQQKTVLVGIAYAVASYFFYTMNDALAKWLVTTMPVVQLLCLRSLFTIATCIASTGRVTIRHAIYSPIRGILLLRGVMILAAWFCYYSAAPYLELGEMVTLYFASPIFVAVLAGKFLKENITAWRWFAIAIGFVGVLAASRLNHLPNLLPSLLVLLAAVLWAISMILYRQSATKETNSVQLLVVNVVLFVVCGVFTLWQWKSMTGIEWFLMVVIGAISTMAQYFLLIGLRRIPASVAAPLEFSSLIWSFVLGYLIWGDRPVAVVIIGAVLISVSGVLIVMEEWWHNRKGTSV